MGSARDQMYVFSAECARLGLQKLAVANADGASDNEGPQLTNSPIQEISAKTFSRLNMLVGFVIGNLHGQSSTLVPMQNLE